jgi:HEXXH motif-containing protein
LSPPRRAETARFVWTAREPFDRFHAKAAAALVAVRKALALKRPLRGGEDEFLELASRVASGDAVAFTRVFTAPPAYAWTVGAFRAVADALAGRAPEGVPSLARQLEGFKGLALGQHWIAQRDLAFAAPLVVDPPFAIPGTAWTLFGPPAAITGLAAGQLVVREGPSTHRVLPGAEVGPFALRCAPVVEVAGAEIALNPYPLAAPELDLRAAPQAAAAGLAYHAARCDLVWRALGIVARYAPATWTRFREVVRVIALQPPGASGFLASSSADAPGAFVASAVDCPFELANFFIHEFHHTRMFVLEALAPVLAVPPQADIAVHYSPWRDDRRPLRGLLHALYVHVPVTHFWLAVHAAADVGPAIAGRAADRAARAALQFDPVLDTLERHGRFSAEGRPVFDEIVRAARQAQVAVRRAGLSGDEISWEGVPPGGSGPSGRPGTVAESVHEHARRFGATGATPVSATVS